MHSLFFYFASLFVMAVTVACVPSSKHDKLQAEEFLPILRKPFGKLPDGIEVDRYTLTNAQGIVMQVINYGGIITALKIPDKNGVLEDVVLGYDSLSDYLKDSPYFGALIGRYGNRIANGKFHLDGQDYVLAQNNNGQHLHGGIKGFDKVYWTIAEVSSDEGPALRLTYESADGEEGYPGNLFVEVVYTLSDANDLKVTYRATTDKKTVVNLTQHSYFNLSGNVKRDILNHELMLHADTFLPVTNVLIPTGEVKSVVGTPFDFTTATPIGSRIGNDHLQLRYCGGYDHCYVLSSTDSLKFAASLYDPDSGRYIEVFTTEPGIQFYSGNFLDGSLTGKREVVYKHRYGLCLETQHFPDSPNQLSFPPTVLHPGQVYKTQTIYRFGVKQATNP
jgi:aldose 1-epimerase